MRNRDTSREVARRSCEAAHWQIYRRNRSRCSKNLKKIKIEHFRNMYLNFEKENDMKSIFRTTKNLLNWKNEGGPHSLLSEGILHRRPVEIANLQLNYFCDKVDKLTSRFVDNPTNPLRWLESAMESWHGKVAVPIFTFK